MAGASDVTLTAAEALHAEHEYTGTLTGSISVIVPASEKKYWIYNNTSGSFTLTVKTSAGTGVLVPQGGKSILYCDGTNVVNWMVHLLGAEFFLDADLDSSLTVDTDDRLDIKLQGQDLFRFDGTAASAVNGADFVAAATGSPFRVLAQGSDTDIGIDIVAKAAKNIDFYSDALELLRLAYVASAVNFPQLEPSATGNNVKFAAFGDDTDVGISFQPKGAGVLDLLTGPFNGNKGADIASATTTDIGAATGNFVDVTGTVTITGLGTVKAGTRRIVQFDGVLTLTHNASSLILPTGANITTAAGDVGTFVSLGGGNWKCTGYMRASGQALAKNTWSTTGSVSVNSGTSVSLVSSLSGVDEIEIHCQGISLDGTAAPLIQIGDAGGLEISGYTGYGVSIGGAAIQEDANSTGFLCASDAVYTAATVGDFDIVLKHMGSNVWSFTLTGYASGADDALTGTGLKTLTGALDRVSITTEGGTASFDASGIAYVRSR